MTSTGRPTTHTSAIHAKWNELHPGTNGNDANIVQTARFRADMREGDLVVVSYGNSRASAQSARLSGPTSSVRPRSVNYNHRRQL